MKSCSRMNGEEAIAEAAAGIISRRSLGSGIRHVNELVAVSLLFLSLPHLILDLDEEPDPLLLFIPSIQLLQHDIIIVRQERKRREGQFVSCRHRIAAARAKHHQPQKHLPLLVPNPKRQ